MSLFQNGHVYSTAIALSPPGGRTVPFVKVEMATPVGAFQPVIGKLDTGAFRTMLSFDTGEILGIADPKAAPLKKARVANDQLMDYYVHAVHVRIATETGDYLQFHLEAGFAEEVQRNLFGIDWLNFLCVAIDRQQVHLLRD